MNEFLCYLIDYGAMEVKMFETILVCIFGIFAAVAGVKYQLWREKNDRIYNEKKEKYLAVKGAKAVLRSHLDELIKLKIDSLNKYKGIANKPCRLGFCEANPNNNGG